MREGGKHDMERYVALTERQNAWDKRKRVVKGDDGRGRRERRERTAGTAGTEGGNSGNGGNGRKSGKKHDSSGMLICRTISRDWGYWVALQLWRERRARNAKLTYREAGINVGTY